MSGGSSSSGQSFIAISISPDPGITLQLHSLHATEELGRPFQYNLSLASDTATPNLASWLGASCTLTMTLPDKSSRYFNGIIGRAVYDGLVGGAYHYRIEMRPCDLAAVARAGLLHLPESDGFRNHQRDLHQQQLYQYIGQAAELGRQRDARVLRAVQ